MPRTSLDPTEARRMRAARTEKERARMNELLKTGQIDESVDSARARRLRAMADRAELEAARLRNELLPRRQVIETVFRLAREERDAFLSWPSRIAAEVAAELQVDPGLLQAALDDRLRAYLASRAEPKVEL